jgi:hypothetical protein
MVHGFIQQASFESVAQDGIQMEAMWSPCMIILASAAGISVNESIFVNFW